MKTVDIIRDYLGDPYVVTTIDREEVVYRNLGNGYGFEISGVHALNGPFTLYVWTDHPRQIVGTYKHIRGRKNLKDVLGYCAVKYQNLLAEIQVECED